MLVLSGEQQIAVMSIPAPGEVLFAHPSFLKSNYPNDTLRVQDIQLQKWHQIKNKLLFLAHSS